MNAEQRSELHAAYTGKVNETDAERRDRWMSIATNRGIVIAELVQILRDVRPHLDDVIGERVDAAIKRGKEA